MQKDYSPTRSALYLVLLLLFVTLSTALPLTCQDKDKDKKSDASLWEHIPFEQWLKEGPKEQIPCKLRMWNAGLGIYQRLEAHIDLQIDGADLVKRGPKGQVIALVEVTDSSGKTYRDEGKLEMAKIKPATRNSDVVLSWDAFVVPGEYNVTATLYHSVTREHSLVQRRLVIPAPGHDPLPNSWRDLPNVEFWDPSRLPEPDALFRPEIDGKLHLPLVTRRPVQIDVLADFTTTDVFFGSHQAFLEYLHVVLPTMKALSQIDLKNGALNIATLDMEKKQVSFEQEGVRELDWARLKKTIKGTDPSMVSVQALKVRQPSPVFLRDEMVRRISAKPTTAGGQHEDPRRILIVLSGPLGFYNFGGMPPVQIPEQCDCRIYYLQYDFSIKQAAFGDIGHFEKMLKPLKVRSFSLRSPQDVRDALAKMLKEIAEM